MKMPAISTAPEPGEPLVYIVDDDDVVRESLLWLVESGGRRGISFASPLEFLQSVDETAQGCLVLDMRMPRMTGFDVQDSLTKRGIHLPIIFITGHGGVPMSVRAMKNGAFDFIEKPYTYQQMLDTIEEALRRSVDLHERRQQRIRAQQLLASLSPREREVLLRTVEGKPVKVIAYELGIVLKTVDVHRNSIRDKLGAESVAQMVRIVNAAQG